MKFWIATEFYLAAKCLNGFVFDGFNYLVCIDFVSKNRWKKNQKRVKFYNLPLQFIVKAQQMLIRFFVEQADNQRSIAVFVRVEQDFQRIMHVAVVAKQKNLVAFYRQLET